MAAAELEGALFDMGGMGLPVANKENKKLEAEVQRKEREIAALQLQVDVHKDRTQAIRDHLKNVRQELQHTQVSDRKRPGNEARLAVLHVVMNTEHTCTYMCKSMNDTCMACTCKMGASLLYVYMHAIM